jgi:hypothetical protein
MKNNICPICVGVSSLWLLLTVGIVWGFLSPDQFIVPIALLMGGSVVGIAYLGEKKFRWASDNQKFWKAIVIIVGMTLAYILVSNISKTTLFIELIMMFYLAYLFFIKTPNLQHENTSKHVEEIEKQMEQCC